MCGNSSWSFAIVYFIFVIVVVAVCWKIYSRAVDGSNNGDDDDENDDNTVEAIANYIFSIQMKCKKDNKNMAWNQKRRRATTTTTTAAEDTSRQTQSSAA